MDKTDLKEKWTWHKRAVSFPSFLSAVIFLIGPLKPYFIFTLLLLPIVLSLYGFLYDYLFQNCKKKMSIPGVINSVSLLSFQIAIWVGVFYIATSGKIKI